MFNYKSINLIFFLFLFLYFDIHIFISLIKFMEVTDDYIQLSVKWIILMKIISYSSSFIQIFSLHSLICATVVFNVRFFYLFISYSPPLFFFIIIVFYPRNWKTSSFIGYSFYLWVYKLIIYLRRLAGRTIRLQLSPRFVGLNLKILRQVKLVFLFVYLFS